MGYQDTANLATDNDFRARLAACLSGEAMGKVGDGLADLILKNPSSAANMFMPLVSASPGFGDKYAAGGQDQITDGDLLSSVQANWARVAALYPEHTSVPQT